MTYQIADARTRYFKDKKHYIEFRKAWSKAVNSVDAKSVKDPDYGTRTPGNLTGAHMLFYALLRGQDLRNTFTNVTNSTRLANGAYVNQGLYFAAQSLKRLSNKYMPEEYVDRFLAPFDGTVEKDILFQVIEEMPEIKPEEAQNVAVLPG